MKQYYVMTDPLNNYRMGTVYLIRRAYEESCTIYTFDFLMKYIKDYKHVPMLKMDSEFAKCNWLSMLGDNEEIYINTNQFNMGI